MGGCAFVKNLLDVRKRGMIELVNSNGEKSFLLSDIGGTEIAHDCEKIKAK